MTSSAELNTPPPPRDTRDVPCQEQRPSRRDWQHLAAKGLYRTGLLRALHGISRYCEIAIDETHASRLAKVRRAKYLVLGYHRVGVGGVPLFCNLSRSVFAEQMRYVRRHFRVLSMKQMADELSALRPKGQAVVVTFDDGYAGTFTEAFPVLQAYQIPATVYLTAGAIEEGEISWYDRIFLGMARANPNLELTLDRPRTFLLHSQAARIEAATEVVMYLRSIADDERRGWCDKFAEQLPLQASEVRGSMMSWNQVRAMKQNGISFGAHTMTHPVTSRLTPDAAADEISTSKRLIEQRLGSEVDEFAFPFGKARDCGAVSATALQCMGFRTALTTIIGINQHGSDPYRLRRLVIGDDTSLARFAFNLHHLFFRPVDEERSSLRPLQTSMAIDR
jgi:peptidoglycan/xylan/chitin deacetylase (PgdA/CDA1 family)